MWAYDSRRIFCMKKKKGQSWRPPTQKHSGLYVCTELYKYKSKIRYIHKQLFLVHPCHRNQQVVSTKCIKMLSFLFSSAHSFIKPRKRGFLFAKSRIFTSPENWPSSGENWPSTGVKRCFSRMNDRSFRCEILKILWPALNLSFFGRIYQMVGGLAQTSQQIEFEIHPRKSFDWEQSICKRSLKCVFLCTITIRLEPFCWMFFGIHPLKGVLWKTTSGRNLLAKPHPPKGRKKKQFKWGSEVRILAINSR